MQEMIAERSVACFVDGVASMFIIPQSNRPHGFTYIFHLLPPLLTQLATDFVYHVLLGTVPLETGRA